VNSLPVLSPSASTAQPARGLLAEMKSRLHLLPGFLIIGVQRGGTTSLYNNLAGHPCIAAARQKELHFFDIHFSNGVPWYRSQFPSLLDKFAAAQKSGRRFITGEATPYYIFHPLAPARIAALLPRIKIIALLRNPVDRAYSHYNWSVEQGFEKLGFEEALAREAERVNGEVERLGRDAGYFSFAHQNFTYLARGVYADQLQVWFSLFAREQFFIESSEAFFQDPARVLGRALEFLSVPKWEPRSYRKFNEGSYRPLDSAPRRRLCEYFQPHNKRLFEMLGVDFRWD
jgi:hypothetical protein